MTCNRDCFNCPYDDCINDEVDAEEIDSIEKRNLNLTRGAKPSTQKYWNNVEKKREQSLNYYYRHREERLAYQRKRYAENVKAASVSKICHRCAKPLATDYQYLICNECLAKKRIYQRKFRESKKEIV